jgi:hypothetical protein
MIQIQSHYNLAHQFSIKIADVFNVVKYLMCPYLYLSIVEGLVLSLLLGATSAAGQ